MEYNYGKYFSSPVRAVYVKSLMDGFEYNDGYSLKHGLFRTDFISSSRTRTIRRSGQFLRSFITQRSFTPDEKDTLYGRFPADFMFGAATAAYQENVCQKFTLTIFVCVKKYYNCMLYYSNYKYTKKNKFLHSTKAQFTVTEIGQFGICKEFAVLILQLTY